MKKKNILIVDDHVLFSNSLKRLIDSFSNFHVVGQLKHGKALITYLQKSEIMPDLILLDVQMPVMGGLETMMWLKENYSEIRVLALSMNDNEETIISIIRNGAKGYILKDIDPMEFKSALEEVIYRGFYYSHKVSSALLKEVISPKSDGVRLQLKARELEFLELACSEKTYKEIASEMFLSPKTIDGYRESIFKKFKVHSRIGLVIFAIKNKLVEI